MKKLIILLLIAGLFGCSNITNVGNGNAFIVERVLVKTNYNGLAQYTITERNKYGKWGLEFTIFAPVGKFMVGDTVSIEKQKMKINPPQ